MTPALYLTVTVDFISFSVELQPGAGESTVMNHRWRAVGWGLVVVSIGVFGIRSAAWASEPPQAEAKAGIVQAMLADPRTRCEEIIFAERVSGTDHWYVNFGYYCTQPDRMGFGRGARLCRLNLRTGELRVLLEDPNGGIRDPQLHYDGKKILFAYRPGNEKAYHLYEINVDGTGLVQLTDGPDDDIEPTYVPDGGIVFCSSRCRRVVNCWLTRVATLYRCEGDGSRIRPLSSNNDHDNTPWVLPDGRLVYMRWEYVDRSQVHFHHLWTANPDGTGQMVLYGNERGGTAMLDAKPVPGTSLIVASFSPGHGRPEHMGYVTLVDPRGGPDVEATVHRVSDRMFRDPYPISSDYFLVADQAGIHVMNARGETELVYPTPKDGRRLECHEPRPLRSRPREPVIAPRVDPAEATGRLVLADVYRGRNMEGVRRGDIKKLLVFEQLPKPVNFSGGQDPLSIGGTFTLARVLGTVPVESDGSAYLELPALRSLFFVALDANDRSVKRMQSFVTLQPGETVGCAGCHEQRSLTPRFRLDSLALRRPPSRPEPIPDVPDVLDFPRDIQPILDRHCARCHNPSDYAGRVDLTGSHTPVFTTSYWTITKRGLVADGRNRPYSQQKPRSIGSSASRLLQLMEGDHYGARPSPREFTTVRLWIESGAPYPGTYAALGSGAYPVEFPLDMMQRRCGACHDVRPIKNPHIHYVAFKGHFGPKGGKVPDYLSSAPWQWPLVPQSRCNLDDPADSILLKAPLAKSAGGLGLCRGTVFRSTSDPDYQKLLTAISKASAELQRFKRFDMPGFRPNAVYIREMQRFGFLPPDLSDEAPIDVYATDRAYWRSFWFVPRSRE